MSVYDLPKSAVINGHEYIIRSDYRAALDIIDVMNDKEITDEERTLIVLRIFYEDFDGLPLDDFQEALDFCIMFISGGDAYKPNKTAKLMDWKQDFKLIVSPINKIIGYEVREVEYLHWWTFLSAYREIGDCLFAQVVSIRKKRMKGQKLDKADAQFYRDNQELIDFKHETTPEDDELFEKWGGQK